MGLVKQTWLSLEECIVCLVGLKLETGARGSYENRMRYREEALTRYRDIFINIFQGDIANQDRD